MAHRLCVVVCAYTLDRWTDIERSVESLLHQVPRPDQIIVVADHNAELLEAVRRRFPEVTAVPNRGEQGLSGARNTGFETADADVIAFLDDDAHVHPGWAAALVSGYEDPATIGVAGWVLPDWRAPRPRWFPDSFLWVVGCSFHRRPEGRVEVRNGIGANMSFRRSVYERIGGFDARVGRVGSNKAGCEETEFSIRARQAFPGSKIVLEPDAVCSHSVTAGRTTRQYFRERCAAEGVSKAVVAALRGSRAGLQSERRYVVVDLPVAVLTGLADFVRGDRGGILRAWTVVEGLAVTTGGYAGVVLSDRLLDPLATRLSRLRRPAGAQPRAERSGTTRAL